MSDKIAIIEDNPDSLELMTYLLQQFGYTIVSSMDGEEGLRLVEREKPDLIICDIQLPKLTGYQIAETLKSNESLAKIPLIAVTAYSMVGDRDKIMAAGYDDYIAKPIDPELFVKEIQRFLRIKEPKIIPTPSPYNTKETKAVTPINNSKLSILVVDDSPDNRELVDTLLKSEGFHPVLADTVEKGLLELDKKIPDLIISDLHLPQINGLEFVRRIKKHAQFRHIPVIILSASKPLESERQECIALGVLHFIVRPIEALEFIKMINEIYQENKGDS